MLRRTNEDREIGSDRNGSSKSSLDALVLWSLTVLFDPRPLFQDARVSNVFDNGLKLKKRRGQDEKRGWGRVVKLCLSVATPYIVTSFFPPLAVKHTSLLRF